MHRSVVCSQISTVRRGAWLLPTQASPNMEEGFDPATYIIGNTCSNIFKFLAIRENNL